MGLAYLWKQNAVRILGNYVLIEEAPSRPNLKIGFGIQSITTGNPGVFATSEKNFAVPEGKLNVYVGIAVRSSEDHVHGVGGIKFEPQGSWAFGLQIDGHDVHPYITHRIGNVIVGYYLASFESSGYFVGVRF
ncbi:hypothetical protein FCG40_03130 [Fimbriimonadia bacterium ATM]|nr:MAG: hypothetical protein EDM73_05260 [Armatimonadota bacterium]MBC6969267.1 hypothetical protein [Armatimonadota bacterium]MCE7899394.1 hypothetical protein [Armatimonadetes bacterium ATM1]MDL1927969.1 hypothetical protein [Fimbriimonadia bacterium ATM]RIJ97447.1 MAG: hypothetical protein DCC45_05320 [Armatimonadota bacterium]